jgi:hypothetical protein
LGSHYGRPQLNIIGKQGGNTFAGTFFMNGSGSAFVSDNLSADQKAKGLSAPLKPKKLFDINPSVGGPIVRDRLWFFGSYRYQFNRQTVATCGTTRTPATTPGGTTTPTSASSRKTTASGGIHSVRLTWQVSPRNKIVGWTDVTTTASTATPAARAPVSPSPDSSPTRRRFSGNENHPSVLSQVGGPHR